MHGSDFNYSRKKKNTVTKNAFTAGGYSRVTFGSFLVIRMEAIIKMT